MSNEVNYNFLVLWSWITRKRFIYYVTEMNNPLDTHRTLAPFLTPQIVPEKKGKPAHNILNNTLQNLVQNFLQTGMREGSSPRSDISLLSSPLYYP